MEAIERAIHLNNPTLYERCIMFPNEFSKKIHLHGLVDRTYLFLKIRQLKFPFKKSYMFDEIAELVYSEDIKTLISLDQRGFVTYLNLTGFQNENYTMAESTDILFIPPENRPPLYTFGYKSTDPIIVDFIQSVSFGTSPQGLYKIRERLSRDNSQNAVEALRKGAPYNLIAEMLLKKCNFWIFSLYPSIFENGKVANLFLELSRHHNGPISAETIPKLANIRKFLMKLSELSIKDDAMEKLLLMIYFPEYAQFIYDSPYPMFAFRDILMGKLTEWRRGVAMKIDWGNDLLKELRLFNCHFSFKNYYGEYKENSMFDDFVLKVLGRLSNEGDLKKRPVIKGIFKDFPRHYKRSVVEGEFQGTVYSIIRDEYRLKWGYIDPLSQEINHDFESECVNLLALKHSSPSTLWLRTMYTDIVPEASIPISRLTFNSRYTVQNFISDYYQNNPKAAAKVARKVYESLANYFQPREGYLEQWKEYIIDCRSLFDEIWRHNVRYCNFAKSLKVITEALEGGGQTDLLTERLLLQILKSIVEMHYSAKTAAEMDFGVWTDSLKRQLSIIFDELHKFDSYRDDEDSNSNNVVPSKGGKCRHCIIG